MLEQHEAEAINAAIEVLEGIMDDGDTPSSDPFMRDAETAIRCMLRLYGGMVSLTKQSDWGYHCDRFGDL